jgi:hypothetical protein
MRKVDAFLSRAAQGQWPTAVVWFEREYVEPEPFPASLPGRWRAAAAYPHPAVEAHDWRFGGGEQPLGVDRLGEGGRAGVQRLLFVGVRGHQKDLDVDEELFVVRD